MEDGMSGEDLFAPRGGAAARPSFEVALRGYDKRQVDEYVSRVDRMVSTLAGERDQALTQVQELATHLEQVQAELTELRQQPPRVDRASFRDLGPTVDQIIALAEHQAQNITDAAAQRAAEHQAEAERVLSDARQEADRLRAEGEAAYEEAKAEAQRINEQSAQHLENTRAEAESLLEAARAQTEQEVQARRQVLTQLQGELDNAQQQLAQVRQEGASLEREISYMQQKLGDVNQELAREMERLENARRAAESAERHAQKVRARVQREAERVAQLAAAAVMAAAERGGETGEYPMVLPVRSPGTNGAGAGASDDQVAEAAGDAFAGERPAGEPGVGEPGPGSDAGPVAGGGDPRQQPAGFVDGDGPSHPGGAGHAGTGPAAPDASPASRDFHPFGQPAAGAPPRELDATQDFPAVDVAAVDARYIPTQPGPHAGSPAGSPADRE